jgi:DNA-binding XRE family transcriptional regulator
LAELIDCSLNAIGNIERGTANPTLVMVYKIAKALNVSAKDIIP